MFSHYFLLSTFPTFWNKRREESSVIISFSLPKTHFPRFPNKKGVRNYYEIITMRKKQYLQYTEGDMKNTRDIATLGWKPEVKIFLRETFFSWPMGEDEN